MQTAVAAILGLLLAFTVSMAVSRFEDRKHAVVDEANAIGTAYLRVSLLPDPLRSQATGAFAKYVGTRLQLARADWFTGAGAGSVQSRSSCNANCGRSGWRPANWISER